MKLILSRTKEEFFDLSYRDLEKLTDVANGRWSDWFTGKVSPQFDKLLEVAEKLEMPWTEFIEAFKERRDRTIANRQKKP